jgi:hypothetical protein
MAKSVLDQLKELDAQREKLMHGAMAEATATLNAALAGVNALGRRFRLVEDSGNGRKGTRQVRDVPCKICGYKTRPPHDARRHRAQKTKKPFTNAELNEMGLEKG